MKTRSLRFTKAFKRDFKKYELSQPLITVLYKLINNQVLDEKYRDHALTGDMAGYRDCHLKPDLLLIYRINETNNEVELLRLNTHSEIFG